MNHFAENATTGDIYGPAMEITDADKASAYLYKLVQTIQKRLGMSEVEASSIARVNLGYYAGYYDFETRVRVERLFAAYHPMLPPTDEGEPTPEEAFSLGIRLADNTIVRSLTEDGPSEAG